MAVHGNSKIKNICMLSVHGYFDPVPQLGRTDTGGQVIYVLELAKALTKRKIRVDIYTRWFDRSKGQIEHVPGSPDVRVIRIPAGPWQFIPKEKIYDILPELAERTIQFISESNLHYDLFHGHYVDAGIVMLDVAKEFDKPAFFTAHSLGACKKQKWGRDPEEMDRVFNFSRRIDGELRIFRSVRAQTVTSKEEKGEIEELYHFRPPRVEFIPPGVDVHLFRPLNENEKEKKTEVTLPHKYIFMAGRISNVKGHDLLLPAFLRVVEEFPDVHLVMAGGSEIPDSEERDVLLRAKRFVDENQIQQKVHIIGRIPHDDLPPYFRQAQLFTLPARYEPFGMTALEAMACEAPAVISRFSGIQENLSSGKNCLLIDPFKTDEYGEAIISLLKNRTLAQNLAKAGCEIARKEFSWEAIAEKHISFYEKFMNVDR